MVRSAGVPASGARVATPDSGERQGRHPLSRAWQAPVEVPQLNLVRGFTDTERYFWSIFEEAADGIFMSDSTGRIVLANSRICEMLGYQLEELLKLDVLETYLPMDRETGRERLVQMPAGTTLRFERLARRKDGSAIPVDVSVAWLPDGERQCIMRDASDRLRDEEARVLEARRLQALVRIFELECDDLDAIVDAALEEGVKLSGSSIGYLYHVEGEAQLYTIHACSIDVKEGRAGAHVATTRGLVRPPIWDQIEAAQGPIVVNTIDAEEVGRSQPGGQAAPNRFMAVPIVSRARTVAVVGVANKPVEYTDTDVSQLGQMMDVVWRIFERQQAEDEIRHLAQSLEARVTERTSELEKANSELAAANAELAAANAQLQKLVREQESLQAELAYRALHDPLTGLGNRAKFQQRLDYAARVGQRGVGVLWIDLDRFKEVNDIFGHSVGDEMLVAVADRLRDVVRERDDVARMGGDEFAVVLPNIVEDEAQMIADRVLKALTDRDAFRLQVNASVGVSWQAPGVEDTRLLVRHADQAMYRAKAAGGGVAALY